MCELFALSSKKEIMINPYLEEFMSHGIHHPNGWGLAIFYGEAVSLEKEPIASYKSAYLKERLKHPIVVKEAIAHIRLATKGKEAYENTHPFVKRDNQKKAWTLAHNGTIFDSKDLEKYIHFQEGQSDSERILYFIKEKVNSLQHDKKRELTKEEKFHLLEEIIYGLSYRNKLNLLIYDGQYLYVHTNYKNSLVQKKIEDGMIFSTIPLDMEEWNPVPFCQVLVYEKGEVVYQGQLKTSEYNDNPEDLKFLFFDSSLL